MNGQTDSNCRKAAAQITEHPIDLTQLVAKASSDFAGATLLFVGSTRRKTGDRETIQLEYDCHLSMAKQKLIEIGDTAIEQFDLIACHLVHRIGMVETGQASIAVAVSSAHRANAFEAGPWIMDEIKKLVPIWKKEFWVDGTSDWIHHGQQPG